MNTTEGVAEAVRSRLKSSDATVTITDREMISVTSPSAAPGRSIEIRVHGPADVEVAFTVPTERGSPFEQLYVGTPAESDAVIHEAVAFVSDLVAERMVVAWDAGWLTGGRKFLKTSALAATVGCKLKWVRSWSGSHDWDAA